MKLKSIQPTTRFYNMEPIFKWESRHAYSWQKRTVEHTVCSAWVGLHVPTGNPEFRIPPLTPMRATLRPTHLHRSTADLAAISRSFHESRQQVVLDYSQVRNRGCNLLSNDCQDGAVTHITRTLLSEMKPKHSANVNVPDRDVAMRGSPLFLLFKSVQRPLLGTRMCAWLHDLILMSLSGNNQVFDRWAPLISVSQTQWPVSLVVDALPVWQARLPPQRWEIGRMQSGDLGFVRDFNLL